MQHLLHSALASGAPIAFFATEYATSSIEQTIHLTSSANAVPDTWEHVGCVPVTTLLFTLFQCLTALETIAILVTM